MNMDPKCPKYLKVGMEVRKKKENITSFTDENRRPFFLVRVFSFLLLFLAISQCLHIRAYSISSEPAEAPLQASFQVLILNSYHPGYKWTEGLEDTLIAKLEERFSRIDISSEYLDWKRHPDEESLSMLIPVMEHRYGDKKISLILTTDDAALGFVLANRKELFHDAPIVFCGVAEERADAYLQGQGNITGVTENFDMEGTVQAILHICPELRQAFLVYENSETGLPTGERATEAFQRQKPEVEIVHWNELTADQIKKKSEALPTESVILYMAYNRDAAGFYLPMDQFADLLFENSSVPAFSIHDFTLGHHILGGSVTKSRDHAAVAAELAVRVLLGEKADSLPYLNDRAAFLEFDYNEMKRFEILESDLPEYSVVINRPFSFYRSYKTLVLIVSLLFLMMLILIANLIVNDRIRKKSARELRESHEELLAANGQMSAMNAHLQDTDVRLREKNTELENRTDMLTQSEERYRLVSNATRDAIWDWEIKGNKRIISDRIGLMLGMTHDKAERLQDWVARVHPDDISKLKKAMADYFSHRTDEYSVEYRIMTRDGNYRWILSRGIAIFGENGKPIRMVGTHSDIDELKQQQETISRMAYYDSLTELPNRVLLRLRSEAAFHAARSNHRLVALLFTDLDNFKVINDTFGHPVGDELLNEVARLIQSSVPAECTVARLGGDEFIVLVPNLAGAEQAETISKWLLNQFKTPLRTTTLQFHISLSIGISLFPKDGNNFDEMMRSADMAMYGAKNAGRSQYRFFDGGMDEQIRDRFALEEGLRTALTKGELKLHFQPIHRLHDDSLAGFEALVRWNSPIHGLVAPDRFIPIAEENGLILTIGEWVLREACLFRKRIDRDVAGDTHIAVNVSVLQLMQENFGDMVSDILHETGVRPGCLVLEITESVLMESFAQHEGTLRKLGESGVSIALDDFGTGYSSLTYLRKLPIQILKIDKSFIDDIRSADDENSHTGAIISLSRQWGLRVVAEGVEQDYQQQYLKKHQCDLMQGYLISKPLPESEAYDYARKD